MGDMTHTKTNLDALCGTFDSLAARVDKSNEAVTKEYMAATTKINAVNMDAIARIAEETAKSHNYK